MKTLKTKGKTQLVELEQESYGVYCINQGMKDEGGRMKTADIKHQWKTLIDTYINYLNGIGRASNTIESHITSLSRWLRFQDEKGGVAPIDVTPRTIAAYQAWFYDAQSRFGRPFTIKSQITGLNNLQVFFKYLYTSGRLLTNPAGTLRLPREPRRLPATILSTKEMKKLLSRPDTHTVLGFRDRTIYEVLYSTGLRVNELIRLRVQDLSPEQGTLFIRQSKHFKDRYVPLGKTALSFSAEYLANVRPILVRENSGDTIFLSRRGLPLNDGGVQVKLRIYAHRAGIKKHLTFHVFRHTLATEMLRRGADLRQIQELLGHRNLRTTQIYTHIVKGELKRIQTKCHPREQIDLPDGFITYRGRNYITPEDRKSEHRKHQP